MTRTREHTPPSLSARPTSRLLYEAPRLETVELRPEERLLTCGKGLGGPMMCQLHMLSS